MEDRLGALSRIRFVLCRPRDPEQPSWNLAQAVAIFACELRMEALGTTDRSAPDRKAGDPAALAAVDRALAEATAATRKDRAHRRLFRTLDRANLSGHEATLWTAFLRSFPPR